MGVMQIWIVVAKQEERLVGRDHMSKLGIIPNKPGCPMTTNPSGNLITTNSVL